MYREREKKGKDIRYMKTRGKRREKTERTERLVHERLGNART